MKRQRLVLPVLSVLGAGLLVAPAPAEIIERVVARVNGEIVTLSDFTARQIAAAQAARVTPDRIELFLRQNNARILQDSIDEVLLLQRAKELGYRIPPEYVAEVIENIKKENNISSEELFQEQLRREGMSVEDLKRSIERSILTRQVLGREVDSKVQVSEADLVAAYEKRREEFTRPPAVRLQEILVAGSDDGEALAQAQALARRARGGEDFETLARAHSTAASAAAGGDLGIINRGDLAPEIEKVAFALEPGGVSEPLPAGESGYKLLRVAARIEGGTTPFAEVREQLSRDLAAERRQAAYAAFLGELRQAAIIDIRVREVPLQVDLPSSGSILDPPEELPGEPEAAPARPALSADPAGDELRVTPQAAPERVLPTGPAPQPSPTPSPLP